MIFSSNELNSPLFYANLIFWVVCGAFVFQVLWTEYKFRKLNNHLQHSLDFVSSNIKTGSIENSWNIITSAMMTSPYLSKIWEELMSAVGKFGQDIDRANSQRDSDYSLLRDPTSIISKNNLLKSLNMKKLSPSGSLPFLAASIIFFFLFFKILYLTVPIVYRSGKTNHYDIILNGSMMIGFCILCLLLGGILSLASMAHERSCTDRTEELCYTLAKLVEDNLGYFPLEHAIFANYRFLAIQNDLMSDLSEHVKKLTRLTASNLPLQGKDLYSPYINPKVNKNNPRNSRNP